MKEGDEAKSKGFRSAAARDGAPAARGDGPVGRGPRLDSFPSLISASFCDELFLQQDCEGIRLG